MSQQRKKQRLSILVGIIEIIVVSCELFIMIGPVTQPATNNLLAAWHNFGWAIIAVLIILGCAIVAQTMSNVLNYMKTSD